MHAGTGNVSGEACESIWSLTNKFGKWRYQSLPTRAVNVSVFFDWLIEIRIASLPNLLSVMLDRAVTRLEECLKQLSIPEPQQPPSQSGSTPPLARPADVWRQMIAHSYTKAELEYVHIRLNLILIQLCKPTYRLLFIRDLKKAPGGSQEDVTEALCHKLVCRMETLLRLGKITDQHIMTTVTHVWLQQAACVVAQSIVLNSMAFIELQVRELRHLTRQKGSRRLKPSDIARRNATHLRYIDVAVTQILAWARFLSDPDIWPTGTNLVQSVPQLALLPADFGTVQAADWVKNGQLPWANVHAAIEKHPTLMLERYKEERERTVADIKSLLAWIEAEIDQLRLSIDKLLHSDSSISALQAQNVARVAAATRPSAQEPRAPSGQSLVTALTSPSFGNLMLQTSLILSRRRMQQMVQLQRLAIRRFKEWESEVGPVGDEVVSQEYLLPEGADSDSKTDSEQESEDDFDQPALF